MLGIIMLAIQSLQLPTIVEAAQVSLNQERQKGINQIQTLESKVNDAYESIADKVNSEIQQQIENKQTEIEEYVDQKQQEIYQESNKQEIKKIVEEANIVITLKAVSWITQYEDIRDSESSNIGSPETEEELVDLALGQIQQDGSYRFYVKSSLSIKEIDAMLKKYDPEISIWDAFESTKDYYEIILNKNSHLSKELLQDLQEWKIPASLFWIEIIEPELYKIESEDYRDQQWSIKNYNIQNYQQKIKELWTKKIKVWIIDTWIDRNHPDLQNVLWEEKWYDFVNWDDQPDDDNWHWTHVAGIIWATINEEGIDWLNDNLEIIPLKICNENWYCPNYAILDALNYAKDHGIDIINMSLWGKWNPDTNSICDAINDLTQSGISIITAAWNNNKDVSWYVPWGCSWAITVWAIDEQENKANFSNYWEKVDVFAPWVNIYSTYRDGTYKKLQWTSMASPYIAGLVSILKSINPKLTQSDIKALLNGNLKKERTDLKILSIEKLFTNIWIEGAVIEETEPEINETIVLSWTAQQEIISKENIENNQLSKEKSEERRYSWSKNTPVPAPSEQAQSWSGNSQQWSWYTIDQQFSVWDEEKKEYHCIKEYADNGNRSGKISCLSTDPKDIADIASLLERDESMYYTGDNNENITGDSTIKSSDVDNIDNTINSVQNINITWAIETIDDLVWYININLFDNNLFSPETNKEDLSQWQTIWDLSAEELNQLESNEDIWIQGTYTCNILLWNSCFIDIPSASSYSYGNTISWKVTYTATSSRATFKWVGVWSTVVIVKSGSKELHRINVTVSPKEITVNTTSVSMKAGWTATVNILDGNGWYTASSNSTTIATVSANTNSFIIAWKTVGTTTIVIKDSQGKSINVSAKIEAKDLIVSPSTVKIKKWIATELTISDWNWGYSVTSANPWTATAAMIQTTTNKITIFGQAVWSTTITVKDAGGKSVTIPVTVEPRDLILDKYFVELNIGEQLSVTVLDSNGSISTKKNNETFAVNVWIWPWLYYVKWVSGGSWILTFQDAAWKTANVTVKVIKPLSVSRLSSLPSINAGEKRTYTILDGSWKFSVKSSDKTAVDVSMAGSSAIEITWIKWGSSATITVTDEVSKKTASALVTVNKTITFTSVEYSANVEDGYIGWFYFKVSDTSLVKEAWIEYYNNSNSSTPSSSSWKSQTLKNDWDGEFAAFILSKTRYTNVRWYVVDKNWNKTYTNPYTITYAWNSLYDYYFGSSSIANLDENLDYDKEWAEVNVFPLIPIAIFVGSLAIWITADYYCELNGWKFYLPSTWTQNNTVNFWCAISAWTTIVGIASIWRAAVKIAATKFFGRAITEQTAKSLGKNADDIVKLWTSSLKIYRFSSVKNLDDVYNVSWKFEIMALWNSKVKVLEGSTNLADLVISSLKNQWRKEISTSSSSVKTYVSKDWLEKINYRTFATSSVPWYIHNVTLDLLKGSWAREIKFVTK